MPKSTRMTPKRNARLWIAAAQTDQCPYSAGRNFLIGSALQADIDAVRRLEEAMRRRDFIKGINGLAITLPLVAHAQQRAVQVIGVPGAAPASIGEKRMLAFHRGLSESGYTDGQNVAVSYLRAEGQYDRLAALTAELVRREVSVIVAPNSTPAALAAKAATNTIPIVFSVATDPVKLGLVSSLARPGGNMTGIYFSLTDLGGKRLGIMRELLPTATTVAVLACSSSLRGADERHSRLCFALPSSGLERRSPSLREQNLI
jgi:ABC-type uncharacterized transport system substrate-binding protein